jgi:hypothetical protein
VEALKLFNTPLDRPDLTRHRDRSNNIPYLHLLHMHSLSTFSLLLLLLLRQLSHESSLCARAGSWEQLQLLTTTVATC